MKNDGRSGGSGEDFGVAGNQSPQPFPVLNKLDVGGPADPGIHVLLLDVETDVAAVEDLGSDVLHEVLSHLNLGPLGGALCRSLLNLNASRLKGHVLVLV